MSFDALVLIFSLIIALVVVPPYFWRVYDMSARVNRLLDNLHFIMASRQKSAHENADIDVVYVPVSHTSMPQLAQPETDEELLTILADYRKPDNKFRFSANQIYTLMGGDRNMVMRQIRELREGKSEAQYPALNPQQAANREALGLPNR